VTVHLEDRLNETLRLLLVRTGQRHSDLGAVIGVNQSSMSARLRGESKWRLDDLPLVADHFGVTVCELITGYSAIAEDRLPPAKGAGQTRI